MTQGLAHPEQWLRGAGGGLWSRCSIWFLFTKALHRPRRKVPDTAVQEGQGQEGRDQQPKLLKAVSDRAPSVATQAFPTRTTSNRQPKRKTNLTSRESKGPRSGPPPSSPRSDPSSAKASTHGQPRQWPADSSPANSEWRSHQPRTGHSASPAREHGLPETSGPRERLGHGHGASSGFTGFAPYLPTP